MNFIQSQQNQNISFLRASIRKQQNDFLINFLTDQIGIPIQIATVLINFHKCKTKSQALQLMTTDQNGLYRHLFLPSNNKQIFCQLCEDIQGHHNKFTFDISDYQQNQYNLNNIKINKQLSNQPETTCQICYVEFKNNFIVNFDNTNHQICFTCMEAYIKQKVMNMSIQNIHCPHCDVKLKDNTIKQLVNQQIYKKYITFLKNIQITNNPNLIWCPNPKCSIVISIKKKKKQLQCPQCKIKICFKCNRQAHSRSCNTVFKNQIKQWENNQHIQKCKKCNAVVEKYAGCNHMSCTVCGYEWCWLCGANYGKYHFNTMNPFGCPGMQNINENNKILLWLKKFFLLIAIIIAVPFLIPVALIVIGPTLSIDFLSRKIYRDDCFSKFLKITIGLIVGLIFDPIFWIGIVIVYFPALIHKLRTWLRERRNQKRRLKSRLHQRLINNIIENDKSIVFQEDNN